MFGDISQDTMKIEQKTSTMLFLIHQSTGLKYERERMKERKKKERKKGRQKERKREREREKE
jgi:hypothetical protein